MILEDSANSNSAVIMIVFCVVNLSDVNVARFVVDFIDKVASDSSWIALVVVSDPVVVSDVDFTGVIVVIITVVVVTDKLAAIDVLVSSNVVFD